MLSIEKCDKILNKNGKKYKKEEVSILREKLYQLANLTYNNYIESKDNE